jgi:hypothetical protein
MLNARRTLTFTFILVTVLFSAFTAYSGYIYYQLFHALRTFQVKIIDFSFYGGQLVLRTEVNIQNPSGISFGILNILEKIEKIQSDDYTYVGYANLDSQENPLDLRPNEDLTVAITFQIPATKIEEVTSGLENTWYLTFTLTVRAFVVGDYQSQWSFETQMESL